MVKERIGKWDFSEKDQLKALEEATKRGEESLANEPRALTASFDKNKNLVVINLNNGSIFSFPPTLIKELRNAAPAEIAKVEVATLGTALHWDDLDAHYTLAGLLNGVFGTRTWMQELGRKGGKSQSALKAQAARKNGAKGGRPKQVVV